MLAAGIPYFGICFGNQLFGRALGFGTFKLGYGHRGINQPVMDLTTRKVEVTAHNHGFAVAAAPGERHQTPYGIAEVSHICLNDDVVEGLQLTDADGRLLAFSVQYHPEAAAGPTTPATSSTVRDLMAPLRGGCVMPRRTDIDRSSSSALVRLSSGRPASSTTPVPRPAGCCGTRASG